jgi:hypothetical protein
MPGPFQIPQDAMMSTQGPTSMGLLERIKMLNPFAGGNDVELPPESGQTDPRLGQLPLQQLMKAFGTANRYQAERSSGTGPIDALRRAGGQ